MLARGVELKHLDPAWALVISVPYCDCAYEVLAWFLVVNIPAWYFNQLL